MRPGNMLVTAGSFEGIGLEAQFVIQDAIDAYRIST